MKAFAQLPAMLLVGTVMLAAPQAAVAQTGKTPENIAEEATVLILREKTIGKGILMSGSGVIIARKPEGKGNIEGKDYTYYVLTANHVVPTTNNYQVETKSGKKYPVDFNTVREISGGECVDLAVLEFRSKQRYQLVKLEKYGNMSKDTPVYISGWVEGSQGPKISRGTLIDPQFPTKVDSGNNSDCTSLAVSELTEDAVAPGMSGGPILNQKGNLIGIFVATRLFGPVRGTSIETFRDRASQELPDVLELADNPIDIPILQPPKSPQVKPPKEAEKEPEATGWTLPKAAGIATIIATAVAIIGLGIKIHTNYVRNNRHGP